MPVIDLNADVGEECGQDEALLQVVTSANVAAGAHAGGGIVLDTTIRLAVSCDVSVGAHPSYPDRAGFGRASMAGQMTPLAVSASIADQVAAVMDAAARAGTAVQHVKAHGSLYHDASADRAMADAFLDGVRDAADAVMIVGMPGTQLQRSCEARSFPFAAEAFADRAYAPDGALVPRGEPGAVLHDPVAVAERVLRLVEDGQIVTIDGRRLPLAADTICVHGDTAGAVAMARMIRARLVDAGVVVSSARACD